MGESKSWETSLDNFLSIIHIRFEPLSSFLEMCFNFNLVFAALELVNNCESESYIRTLIADAKLD